MKIYETNMKKLSIEFSQVTMIFMSGQGTGGSMPCESFFADFHVKILNL